MSNVNAPSHFLLIYLVMSSVPVLTKLLNILRKHLSITECMLTTILYQVGAVNSCTYIN